MEKKSKQLLNIPKHAPLTMNIDKGTAPMSPPKESGSLDNSTSIPNTPLQYSADSLSQTLQSPKANQKRIGRPPKKKTLISPSQTPISSPKVSRNRDQSFLSSDVFRDESIPKRTNYQPGEEEIIISNQLISKDDLLNFFVNYLKII